MSNMIVDNVSNKENERNSPVPSVVKNADATTLINDGTNAILNSLVESNYLLSQRLQNMETSILQLSTKINRIEKVTDEIRSLVGPIGIPMPDGEMLVQTIYGVKYLIDPSDIIMAPNLIVYRQWESDLSSLLWKSLNSNSVFVDVGANLGYFTCLAASRIGRSGSGQVFAVEPNPNCLKLIDKNIVINWSMAPVTIFRGAVGEQVGKVNLAIPKNRAANASLSVNALSQNEIELTEVAIAPLDLIIPADVVVDYMKIDVEGHEYAALQGAASVISRSEGIKIILEWSPSQMTEAGYSRESMSELFSRMSLRPYRIADAALVESGSATPISNDELISMEYDNLILTH